MLGAFVIVFREVIEAGLIVGIVLAATRGVPGRGRWVAFGIVAGLFGASLVAAFAGGISEAFDGSGQELLNAAILLLAVAMLAAHNVWMVRHGAELAGQMRAVGRAVSGGEKTCAALAVVVGIAVLREGSEVVLFLFGILASGASGVSTFLGGLLGLGAGAVLSALSYLGLLAIPGRHVFAVTSALITLVAAGLAAQAVQFLNAAGSVTILDRRVWDTSWVLAEDGIPGRLLHTLIGYTDRPTQLQLLVYLATIAAIALMMRIVAKDPPMRPAAEAAGARLR